MKFYRDYKHFDIEAFKTESSKVLSVSKIENYSCFQETSNDILHKHAPIKKSYKINPCISKSLRK